MENSLVGLELNFEIVFCMENILVGSELNFEIVLHGEW
jgi:hypothetical protein